MNKLKVTQKEYQILNHLLFIMIRKKKTFLANKNDLNEFEKKKKKKVTLNVLNVPYNTEEIRHVYKSKYNLNHQNQVNSFDDH